MSNLLKLRELTENLPPRTEESWSDGEFCCSITENCREILSLRNPDGTYKYITPSIEKLTGWSPKELIGKKPEDFTHAKDKKTRKQELKKALKSDELIINETRFKRKDGTFINIQTVTQGVFNEDGSLKEIHSSSREIIKKQVYANS